MQKQKAKVRKPISSGIVVLNIGQELLDGRTVNTNASYFAGILAESGVILEEIRCVRDVEQEIVSAIRELSKFQYVIVTGGLGPTADDITARAAAVAFHDQIEIHALAKKYIENTLKKISRPYTKDQERQAMLPSRAKVLNNRWGIAPGFSLQEKYFFLPGVPRECRPMFLEYVLPKILRRKNTPKKLAAYTWRCFGMREIDIHAKLSDFIQACSSKYGENFQFSSQIPYPLVDIRMEFWHGRDTNSEVPKLKEYKKIHKEVKKKLGSIVYSEKAHLTLPEVVFHLLKKYKYTLATAESCTGGWVGKLITDIAGSSEIYLGGAISYANSAKEIFLAVDPNLLQKYGAVSKEVACAMAEGICAQLHSKCSIAITGISGPSGGNTQKPVGTVYVAISGPWGTECEHHVIKTVSSSREQNRNHASHLALDMLRKKILAHEYRN